MPAPPHLDDASTPRASAAAIDDDAPVDAVCRVCLLDIEELPESRLVKLECACVGVYVHETCAEKWLRTKGSNVCEVCKESTQFDVPESLLGRLLRRAGVASERVGTDRDREYGPAVGDVIWIFLTTFCSVWTCLQLLIGLPIGPALAMSYCYALAILMGIGFWILPLRRGERAEKRQSCISLALRAEHVHNASNCVQFGVATDPDAGAKDQARILVDVRDFDCRVFVSSNRHARRLPLASARSRRRGALATRETFKSQYVTSFARRSPRLLSSTLVYSLRRSSSSSFANAGVPAIAPRDASYIM